MSEQLKPNNFEEQPEKNAEQTPEEILDALESAFEKGIEAELTVSKPNGKLRTSSVFVEGLEGGILFVSSSKESPVVGIPIGDIKKVESLKLEN